MPALEYNTALPQLIISEYGRNIQKMIDYAKTVAEREERNKIARSIIDVMGQLNPHLRDVNDFKHKLWDHLFVISNFELDVDSPYPMPTRETFETKPDRVKYPANDIRFKHYGKTIEVLIEKALTMEEGAMKEAFVENIANTMKRNYVNWNKDGVTDDLIFKQLRILANDKLNIKDDLRLAHVEVAVKPPITNNMGSGKKKKKKFKKY